MKKTLGIFIVFVVICLLTSLLSDVFLQPLNLENVIMRIGLYGIMAIGVSFVIMTGGIDLSLGSMVCLTGCGLPWLLVRCDWSPWSAIGLLFVMVAFLGFAHGWMVTKWRLQPFIVTLCGLLMYRGIMRGVSSDQSQGFGTHYDALRWIAIGDFPLRIVAGVAASCLLLWFLWGWRSSKRISLKLWLVAAAMIVTVALALLHPTFPVPMPFVLLLCIASLASLFLNQTVWGQHLLALGNNEEAARFSGVRTHRLIIASYVICALLAGLAGVLFSMDVNSAQPSDFGNFYELYAIAAAVLGGCSLRGGQGAVLGVLIGTALIQVLRNMIVLLFPQYAIMDFAVIGVVILLGVIGDEIFKRAFAKSAR